MVSRPPTAELNVKINIIKKQSIKNPINITYKGSGKGASRYSSAMNDYNDYTTRDDKNK